MQTEDDEPKVDVKTKIKQAKIALKRSKQKDLYAILGVNRDADDDEIRKVSLYARLPPL